MVRMSRHWPLFKLRIRTSRLELRLPTEALLDDIVDTVLDGVHDPAYMPFKFPWTDAPRDELVYNTLSYHWQKLASFSVESWALNLAVVVDGKGIGIQEVAANDFLRVREVMTGSWIGRAHQGQGVGSEMRAAVLHFAFECLGAEFANSGAWSDNERSLAVSRKCGYGENGVRRAVRRDELAEEQLLRLSRADWQAHRSDLDIQVEGFDASLFGLEAK